MGLFLIFFAKQKIKDEKDARRKMQDEKEREKVRSRGIGILRQGERGGLGVLGACLLKKGVFSP